MGGLSVKIELNVEIFITPKTPGIISYSDGTLYSFFVIAVLLIYLELFLRLENNPGISGAIRQVRNRALSNLMTDLSQSSPN